ncbi:MAG TPA: LuxR C-terminal-related transcriptional regulator [Albitalea sp.]|nr:LuxR C-terminal-related transcriptional regulator [Albitalea sp.]
MLSDTDLLLAFDVAPVGLCVSRRRVIQRCNEAYAAMFGYSPGELVGCSLAVLYPSIEEFEHIGARGIVVMRGCGRYSDQRIMKHRDGHLFWCHVAGRSLDPKDPFDCAIWMFEDLSARRPLTVPLTPREREISQLLVEGKSSKQIAHALGLSPRTIDAHRARLLHKLKVRTPGEMLARLAGRV